MEVKAAFFGINTWKTPGPNGIPALFYHKLWGIIGSNITVAVLEMLHSGRILRQINHTFIHLIPKVPNYESFSQFCPISLYNVIYKGISKCITNRLKKVMTSLIGPHQNAFVPRRLIGDSCLIVHELLHYIKRKRTGPPVAAIKIDLNKAYGRLQWDFVEVVLRQVGFPKLWISLIMECITTVSYSLLINGKPSPPFKPKSGIRLCMDVLSDLLIQARENRTCLDIKISRDAPLVNHLLFADDVVFFTSIQSHQRQTMYRIIQEFCSRLGEVISMAKSYMITSPNTKEEHRHMLHDVFNMKTASSFGTYLRVPATFQKSKGNDFNYLIEKVQKKLQGWKTKLLPSAGWWLLINNIVAALFQHTLLVYQVPIGILQKFKSLIMNFFWTNSYGNPSIHLTKKE